MVKVQNVFANNLAKVKGHDKHLHRIYMISIGIGSVYDGLPPLRT